MDKVVVAFPLLKLIRSTDLSFLKPNWEMRLYRIIDKTSSVQLAKQIAEAASRKGADVSAEPNLTTTLPKGGGVMGSPGSPPLSGNGAIPDPQWSSTDIGVNLPRGLNLNEGSRVMVGIFDTCPQVKPTWIQTMYANYLTGGAAPTNGNYSEHGPSVGALIKRVVSLANNAPQLAPKLDLYCVLGLDGTGNVADLIAALGAFITNTTGRGVINLSLRVMLASKLLERTLDAANGKNFVIAAAAGNESTQTAAAPMNYPANYQSWMIGVAGSNYARRRSDFSNQGKVAAPAGGVTKSETDLTCTSTTHVFIVTPLSTSSTGFLCWQGTSFATAFVSGEAALILSKNLNLSADSVRNIIYTKTGHATAPPDPMDPNLGAGIINITGALQ
ncbi:MAG: S8 family serine peptidase [Caldilineaceae bacterium]